MMDRAGRAARVARALVSLALLVLLMLGAPVALIAASSARFGSPNPLAGVRSPWRWTGDDVAGATRRPLSDDTVIDAIVRVGLVVIWVTVAIVVVTTIVETLHVVRHRFPLPHVRGLGWAQHLGRFIAAGLIVVGPWTSARLSMAAPQLAVALPAAAVAEVVEAPTSTTMPSGPVARDATRGATVIVTHAPGPGSTATHASTEGDLAPSPAPEPRRHVVERGESVWSIAADLALGDPPGTVEIADAILDANLGAVMGDGQRFTNPAYIETGWVLEIPAPVDRTIVAPSAGPGRTETGGADPEHDHAGGVHVVQPGDTLSAIAAEHLGDADRWPEVWRDNAHTEMSGGRSFDDPDLILPGWELDIPATAEPAEPDEATPDDPAPAVSDDDPAEADDEVGAPTPEADVAPGDPIHTGPEVPAATSAPGRESGPTVPAATTTATTVPSTTAPSTTAPSTTAPSTTVPSTTAPSTTATTTPAPVAGNGRPTQGGDAPEAGPSAPGPIRIEHAAMLAAGILALVGVRRHLRLRSARPRSRVPEPPPDVSATERRLRTIDPGERAARLDVAVRAAAAELSATEVRIGLAALATDGDIELRLTGAAELPPPWVGAGAAWNLPASVPVEMITDAARRVGQPCVALVQIGVADDGSDILIDLEASGLLTVEAESTVADDVVAAIAAGLGGSVHAEVAHLITVSLPEGATLGHRNAHRADTVDAALELAADLVGSTLTRGESTFTLRSRQTGGEVWEPAVILLAFADELDARRGSGGDDHERTEGADGGRGEPPSRSDLVLPSPGHGLAIVAATTAGRIPGAHRLVACAAGWALEAFGCTTELTPVGLPPGELTAVTELLDDARRPLVDDETDIRAVSPVGGRAVTGVHACADDEPGRSPIGPDAEGRAEAESAEFVGTHHEILVSVMGPVAITDRDGTHGVFERSKTVELIAWLATHRSNSTRAAARTALWELDVRDATFANVVSEARRGLGRLVPPRDGVEWLERTLNEQLPLHAAVVTDAQLIEERLRAATLQPPGQAIETLRPAVELVRDIPFAGTSYLWPDAEGLTSNLVLLATSVAVELAAHGLSTGDIELVFWATSRGLKVLPGHEESIGLRMKAHAEAGDLSGVRQEWDAYERVVVADAWSDGEPAPKLLALRRELLDARR